MKTYKCKKCQTEFQDLNKYRAHILKCKGEPEEEKPEDQEGKLEETTGSANGETAKQDSGETTEPNEETKKSEETSAASEVKEPKIPLERARQLNSCRGEFEGKYREICSRYDKCADCWADYGE